MNVALLVLRTGRMMLAAPARWRLPHWICSFALASAVALACVYRLPLRLQIEPRLFFARGGHGISGHAAATALLVLPARDVLLRRGTPLIRCVTTVALLTWTAVVGWSRVWMGMHCAWSSLAGAALGFWASAAAVAAWRKVRGST
jgi:membrane-associated phospholipid phosphatase